MNALQWFRDAGQKLGFRPAAPAYISTGNRQRDAAEHVKSCLRANNYALSHRDDLFGAEEADMWDAAEEWIERFANSEAALAFEQAYIDSLKAPREDWRREHREQAERDAAALAASEAESARCEKWLEAAKHELEAAAGDPNRERRLEAKTQHADAGNALKAQRIAHKELVAKLAAEKRARLSSFKPYIFTHVNWLGRSIKYSDAPILLTSSPRFLDIANDYYGEAAKIRMPTVWRVTAIPDGVEKPPREGSQRWHRDQTDTNILKLFIYFSDVDTSTGALEYIPDSLPTGGRWAKKIPLDAQSGYPPHSLMAQVRPRDIVECSGRKGTLAFVDTAGLHRGGYATGGPRITVQSTYMRPKSLLTTTPLLPAGRSDDTLTPEQLFAFS
jgi:hypothetical protein